MTTEKLDDEWNTGSLTPLEVAVELARPNYIDDAFANVVSHRNAREAYLHATNKHPEDDSVWSDLDTEAVFIDFASKNDYNFPFLLGFPSTSRKTVAFEDFVPSPDVGFWLTPNLDTVTLVVASLMQFTNFTFASAKVAK